MAGFVYWVGLRDRTNIERNYLTSIRGEYRIPSPEYRRIRCGPAPLPRKIKEMAIMVGAAPRALVRDTAGVHTGRLGIESIGRDLAHCMAKLGQKVVQLDYNVCFAI